MLTLTFFATTWFFRHEKRAGWSIYTRKELFVVNCILMLQQKFSKMGLIKTPICSTMSHERLNHCMIFPTHKEEVDKLNLKKLATDFVLDVPKRKKKICSA